MTAPDAAPNAFQAGINSVSWLLIRFALAMVPLVFVVNGFTRGDWLQAFLFALSVAVGLSPEMLPMIVTSTLAKGAVLLARKKVVVKRLDAIQNFGAMDTLCTDKTGPMTQDKIALARHANVFGQDTDEVLSFAFLNSYYQTGLKNLLICKGAVKEMLAACTSVRLPDPIDASLDGDLIFAKLSPLHKERLVRALRANGHVVGFIGDGINDALFFGPISSLFDILTFAVMWWVFQANSVAQ